MTPQIVLRRIPTRTYYTGQDVLSVRLTKAQEKELFLALKASPDDPKVVEKIVVSFMAFSLRQARKDMGMRSSEARQKVGLSEDDAISAANLGLMEAIRRFDPTRDIRFTTYAGWWIKKYLAEARYSAHAIKVSSSDRKLYSVFAKMARAGLRVEEMAETTGHAVAEVTRILAISSGRQDSFDQWSERIDQKAQWGDTGNFEGGLNNSGSEGRVFSDQIQDNGVIDGDTPEELEKKELLEKLESAKLKLGKDEMSLVYDHFSRGHSISQLARSRDKSCHEIKQKLSTILRTLKICLQH